MCKLQVGKGELFAAKIPLLQADGMMSVRKRLERRPFKFRLCVAGDRVELDMAQLTMLLGGIDFAPV